jgi:DNA-binding NarL/FixJ family response regulator
MTIEAPTERLSPVVLVVDDHRLVGQGLRVTLMVNGFDAHLASCSSADEVVHDASRLRPDVVLLDLQLAAAGHGRDLVRPLADLGAAVVVLTGETDRVVLAECLDAGAVGVASKAESYDSVIEAVQRAAAGDHVTPVSVRAEYAEVLRQHRAEERQRRAPFEALSRREREVLVLMLDGVSVAVMAEKCYVSLPTVRTQIRSVLQKLAVNSQLEATALARSHGWRPQP